MTESFTRKLEQMLAPLVAHFEKRIDRLESALATERRLAALEAVAMAVSAATPIEAR